jgi:hypothetical protein
MIDDGLQMISPRKSVPATGGVGPSIVNNQSSFINPE